MISLIDIYAAFGAKDERVEDFLYSLMAERLQEGDTNISHVKMPTLDEHRSFIQSHVYRGWYVAENEDGHLVGAVSITNGNELGIVVSKRFRHRGYAKAALLAIMAKHPPLPGIPSQRSPHYLANIRHGNQASINLFESLGAKLLQHTYTF